MRTFIRPLVVAAFTTLIASSALAAVISAQGFVGRAASGNMFEVKSSEMLLKSDGANASPEVRAYAEKMVTDHTAVNKELETIADSHNLSFPDGPDPVERALLDELQSASSDSATYAKMQVAGQTAMVAMFEDYATNGENQALKTFALDTLPTLKMNRDMASKLPGTQP